MTDFLHPKLDEAELGRISALGLAHIGDGGFCYTGNKNQPRCFL